VSATLWLALGFIGGVLCSLGGWLIYDLVRPARPPLASPTPLPVPTAPPCSPFPTPPPTPEPTPTAEATPAPLRPTPVARATPTPGPATPHPDIARRLQDGDKAAADGRLEAAVAAYDQALQLDPGNSRAQEGKSRAAATLAALKRGFVAELTESDGGGVGRGLSGFEPGDVVVKKAPQVPARIEFEMHPARVKPGDAYAVSLYLTNTGKRTVKIRTLRLAQTANGVKSASEPVPQVREVKRGQRAKLATLNGTWNATKDWSCEATIISDNGDAYGRRLVWR
jgi:hypothetical protein